MSKYRKKPVLIEAFRFGFEDIPDWFIKKVSQGVVTLDDDSTGMYFNRFEIKKLKGVMTGIIGNYIIKGVKGEIYTCKADIFKKTYELVES